MYPNNNSGGGEDNTMMIVVAALCCCIFVCCGSSVIAYFTGYLCNIFPNVAFLCNGTASPAGEAPDADAAAPAAPAADGPATPTQSGSRDCRSGYKYDKNKDRCVRKSPSPTNSDNAPDAWRKDLGGYNRKTGKLTGAIIGSTAVTDTLSKCKKRCDDERTCVGFSASKKGVGNNKFDCWLKTTADIDSNGFWVSYLKKN